MLLRIGYELIYDFPQPTPIILLVNIVDSRVCDLVVPDRLVVEPAIPITGYRDAFGNRCHRVRAPAGRLRLTANGVIRDSGIVDEPVVGALQRQLGPQCKGRPQSRRPSARPRHRRFLG